MHRNDSSQTPGSLCQPWACPGGLPLALHYPWITPLLPEIFVQSRVGGGVSRKQEDVTSCPACPATGSGSGPCQAPASPLGLTHVPTSPCPGPVPLSPISVCPPSVNNLVTSAVEWIPVAGVTPSHLCSDGPACPWTPGLHRHRALRPEDLSGISDLLS